MWHPLPEALAACKPAPCAPLHAQWGSQEYHKQSLRNLREATQRTKRMCAVLLDTIGRELIIRREYTLDDEVRCTALKLPKAWLPPLGLLEGQRQIHVEAAQCQKG